MPARVGRPFSQAAISSVPSEFSALAPQAGRMNRRIRYSRFSVVLMPTSWVPSQRSIHSRTVIFQAPALDLYCVPNGHTDDPQIPRARSIIDYVARRLAIDWLPHRERASLGVFTVDERVDAARGWMDIEDARPSRAAHGDAGLDAYRWEMATGIGSRNGLTCSAGLPAEWADRPPEVSRVGRLSLTTSVPTSVCR